MTDNLINKTPTLNELIFPEGGDIYRPQNGYHIIPDTWEGRVSEIFGAALPPIQNGLILDMGSSIGETTDEIAGIYPTSTIVGMDINRFAIAAALKQGKKGHFLIGDGFDAPFGDKTFDAVFCMNNLYQAIDYMDSQLVHQRLHQVARMTKDRGYLLISGERGFHEYDFIILQNNEGAFVPTVVQFSKNDDSVSKLEIILDSF